jgi:hypothetical protein
MGVQVDMFDAAPIRESAPVRSELGATDYPEMLRVISLWEPYASLVVNGVKTIETRTWAWPYPPSWLVIQAAKHFDKEAFIRLRLPEAYREAALPGGCLIGLVWVSGPSRPLLPDDERPACFYAPNRHAWPLAKARRFAHPIPFRGPQKFSHVERHRVLEALGQ